MNRFSEYAQDVLSTLAPPGPAALSDVHIHGHFGDLEASTISMVDAPGLPQEADAAVSGRVGELSTNEREILDGEFAERGLDVCAFYKSIRFQTRPPFLGKWGVFVFDFGIDYLIPEISTSRPSLTLADKRDRCFAVLRNHELYHFRIDVWCLSVEAITRKSHYETYLNQVYMPYHPNELVIEETLANKFALDCASKAGDKAWLKRFMRTQPGAYAQIDRDDQQAQAELSAQIIDGAVMSSTFTGNYGWAHTPFIGTGRNSLINPANCPIYVVSRLSPKVVYPKASFLPQLTEIRNKYLPNYLRAVLKRRTDHEFMTIDNGEEIKLPNAHRERLSPSEYKNILLKAGMTPREFKQARQDTDLWKRNCPRPEPKQPLYTK
jgi:hypothetical protein